MFFCCLQALRLTAAEPAANPAVFAATPGVVADAAARGFDVTNYVVAGSSLIANDELAPLFAKYTGTNVGLEKIVRAAADLHQEFNRRGYPLISVAIAPDRITNGIVTLNVFQTTIPQVVVSGQCYLRFTGSAEIVVPQKTSLASAARPGAGNAAGANPSATATNAGPRFAVQKYLVTGNSVLSPQAMAGILTNVDGAFGTNVSLEGIRSAVKGLQQAYQERGYVTVAVGLPPQKLTNATVKVQVTEGRLAAINVTGNRYFSSNNVMRALPSLHTNMLLNGPIFQAELNRANASQDRQIYPVVGPGPEPGTSALTLRVKDQMPVHGKLDFNNENSPGTPDFRVNASAVADNLWQLDHSFGVQYGFSPQQFKQGPQWDFYDQPQVANYSGFYRLPLGNPAPLAEVVAGSAGSFGYDEATRQFRLPPSSGQAELNLYGSRATIDTGLETLLNQNLTPTIPAYVRQIYRQEVQQGITINETAGFQLSQPLPPLGGLRSALAGGLDYKTYSQNNYQTNNFKFVEYTKGPNGNLIQRVSYVYVPTPATDQELQYVPLELAYNGSLQDWLGAATLGLGVSANLWYASTTAYSTSATNPPANLNGRSSLQGITGSTESSGNWVTLRPSFSQDFVFHTNWVTKFRADGQWASEPLISNEQFGIGGVNSVRGYHEGEVFGDTGWHVSLEQFTPPHRVGMIHGNIPLTLRASAYMDLAEAYLLDPQGRPDSMELWGTGCGFTASVGSFWQARFLFSWPLIGTVYTPADQPYFNFGLTAQF